MTSGPLQPSGLALPWRPAALLAGLLCCVYLLSYAGAFRVDDEHILAARAQSLALRGQFDEPQVYGNSRARQLSSLGDQATQIEPLQTVLGAALYRLGRAVGLGGAQTLLTLNLYLTALTGAIVFLTVVVLGFGRKVGVWCGLLFGLATMAWPYASTFLRDSLAMALTAVAFLGWALLLRDERKWRLAGLSAIAIGLAGGILTKNTVWAVALSLTIAALLRWSEGGRTRRGRSEAIAVLALIGAAVLLLVANLPATGPLARFSAGYFSFLLSHVQASAGPALLAQVAGPFASPAKSIFLFSPPLLLATAGAFLGWKGGRTFIVAAWSTAVLLALAQALFYRDEWAGTFGWGLRFMLPAIPPLVVVGAWAVRYLLAGGAIRRSALWAITVLGVLVQLAGAWVSWNRVYAGWNARGLDPFDPSSAWDVARLAIPPQLALLRDPTTWSAAWFRVWRAEGGLAWMIPLGAVVLLMLCAWTLSVDSRRRVGRSGLLSTVLLAAVLAFPVWPAMMILKGDSAFGGDQPVYAETVQRLRREAGREDVIVVDPYASPLWAAMINTWDSPSPWYSLPIELPGAAAADVVAEPSSEVVTLFGRLLDSSSTVWYAAAGEVPPGSRESKLRWLEEHGTSVGEIVLEGASPEIVLRAYRNN